MTTVSEYFKLNKSQLELDFVNVLIEKNKDLPLFIDPWAIHIREDERWIRMYNLINKYFQTIVNLIRGWLEWEAKKMLSHAIECKEIKLWVWKWGFGKWIWWYKYVDDIIKSLKTSKSVKTWSIQDIEDMILVIEWISYDRISDLIANVLKFELIKYTEEQCNLLNIPMYRCDWMEVWDWNKWYNLVECHLPFINDVWWLILVPRAIVRKWNLAINSDDFYNKYILPYEQMNHLKAGSLLCKILENWEKRPPNKKELKEIIVSWKETNEKYIVEYPKLLDDYKESLKKEDYNDNFLELFDENLLWKWWNERKKEKEKKIVNKLIEELKKIIPGKKDEWKYQNFIIWCLIYIFHPILQFPKKEENLNKWRKRIDISMINSANYWFFLSLAKRQIPCNKIYFECKNYSQDIGNSEYDQLLWRFTENNTKIWFIVARDIKDCSKMKDSLKFPAVHQWSFIYVLTDDIICNFMKRKSEWRYDLVEKFLSKKFEELIDN